jgi:hypothetical protein
VAETSCKWKKFDYINVVTCAVAVNSAYSNKANKKGEKKMKETLTTGNAARRLYEDEYAGWSYAGARALVEYLEELEDEIGEEIEFDVVALRCEYTEYGSAEEAVKSWSSDNYEDLKEQSDGDADELKELCMEYLRKRTAVIEIPGSDGVIIQNY